MSMMINEPGGMLDRLSRRDEDPSPGKYQKPPTAAPGWPQTATCQNCAKTITKASLTGHWLHESIRDLARLVGADQDLAVFCQVYVGGKASVYMEAPE